MGSYKRHRPRTASRRTPRQDAYCGNVRTETKFVKQMQIYELRKKGLNLNDV